MRKLLNWLDKYLLEIGISILLLFIPLYPKLPLLDVRHTWTYIRLEDVFVAVIVGIWLVQLLRRKVSLKVPLTIPIIFYWLVGGISLLFSLIFLKAHLANFFPNVAVLHYFRRIEYLVVFFVAAGTIKDVARVKRYLFIAAIALLGVCLYGFGQKFFGLPAFLTMNEEFSKGIPLYLPSTARMASTFAGHYDLAAYLVLMITFFGSLIFSLKKKLSKIVVFLLIFASFILLLFTASRISFIAYLLAISLMLYLHNKKWLIIPVVLASFLLMSYATGASIRFGKTFRVKDVVYDVKTGKPIAAVEEPSAEEPEEELPLGTSFISVPIIETKPPEATKIAVIRKSLRTATMSGEVATISGEFLIRRTVVFDISFSTRFQGTWPRALNAFRRNPTLGTGYSSIGLGTDNSYFRAIGETGALGLTAFLGLFFALGLLAKQSLKKITSPFGKSVLIGMAAGTAGLMINAVLIDVFEASKVAFIFWAFWGITAGMVNFYLPKRESLIKEGIKIVKLPIVPIIILVFLTPLVLGSSLENYFVADDFTWFRWAAKSTMADISQFFLSAQGFFYRPLAKTYFLLVELFFGLRPSLYHSVNFIFHFGCILGGYLVALRLTRKKLVALLASLIFLIHPINAESIFWVSSTSALFASFFYFWGFLAYLQWRSSQKKWKSLFFLLTFLSFVFGLASHELMITFPLVLLLYDFVFKQFEQSLSWGKKLISHLPFWLLISIYLWLRNGIAQAHGLSGDYNYSLPNLPFNFAGNLFGYAGELIASFRFIPFYNLTRAYLRSHELFALILLVIGFLIIKKLLKRFRLSRPVIFSIGWFVILLLPFLGLGNIADRHVYPAHFGFFILMALFVNWLYEKLKNKNRTFALCFVILLVSGILGFYQSEMEKAKQDWRQAGETANKILLAIGSNYIEFPLDSTLYFVNLPIRFGQAWVFPVGLEDGLWFIYRDETLKIEITTDLEETLALTKDKPNVHVFLFENEELIEMKQ